MNTYNQNLYPFESKWINIKGNHIHYVDEGEGEIILFCHAPLGSSFMYRNFIKTLKRRYRCIALDFPGFGLSKAHPLYQYTISMQSNVLEKFVDQLKLNNIHVLGHDTGGPSVFLLAARRPELFNGIIFTDTLIFPVLEYPKINKMLNIVGGKFFSNFNAITNFLVRGTFNYGVRTKKLTTAEKQEYYKMFNTKEKRKLITKMLYNLKESNREMVMIKTAFETFLNDIPSLLIYGEKDPVNILGIPDRIQKLLQNAELYLIKNEGHFPHEAQPEQMSNIIQQWLIKVAKKDKVYD